MATRIYLPSSGSAPVTPSTWNHTNQAGTTYTLPGVIVKSGTAMASRTTATGTTSPYVRAVMRYVIGPLTANQISGTVKLQMLASENNSGANATFSIAVKIIQLGGADRSVLLAATAADSASSPYEFATTLTNRRAYNASEQQPITLTAQTPTTGDYLVIEIGFRSATTTTRNVVLRHGDDGTTDLGDNTTDTNSAYNPYVEFSQDIAWQMSLPTVTTQAASDVTSSSATANGNITNRGGQGFCDSRGFVYGKSSRGDPGNVAPGSSGYTSYTTESGSYAEGAFTGSLSGLDPSSTYYKRAWTHNSAGYSYGAQQSFETESNSTEWQYAGEVPAALAPEGDKKFSLQGGTELAASWISEHAEKVQWKPGITEFPVGTTPEHSLKMLWKSSSEVGFSLTPEHSIKVVVIPLTEIPIALALEHSEKVQWKPGAEIQTAFSTEHGEEFWRSYPGEVQVSILPEGTYFLHAGPVTWTWSGETPLSALPAGAVKFLVTHAGELPLSALLEGSTNIIRSYHGEVPGSLSPEAAYSFEVIQGGHIWLFDGSLELSVILESWIKAERSYQGEIPISLDLSSNFNGSARNDPIHGRLVIIRYSGDLLMNSYRGALAKG